MVEESQSSTILNLGIRRIFRIGFRANPELFEGGTGGWGAYGAKAASPYLSFSLTWVPELSYFLVLAGALLVVAAKPRLRRS
jgi:hypothetical protein